MCVAIPARIMEINGTDAVVDIEGIRRQASLMLVEGARVGDYVILHAGFAITVINAEDASKSLSLLREMLSGTERDR